MAVRSARTPWDQDDGVTQLQESVLILLEEAGIPTSVNDQICRLIEQAEQDLSTPGALKGGWEMMSERTIKRFSSAEDRAMTDMRINQKSLAQIAAALGRSKSSIQMRLEALARKEEEPCQ